MMKRRTLKGSVVVITGASSGIGRATALELARRGALLALAARRPQPLIELAGDCGRLGARAIAVPTDITDPEQVDALARHALDTFGRIDSWINDAAVTSFGSFEETPPEAFRRVLETNFFGTVHGARTALARFREQGSGVLVNVDSVIGHGAFPFQAAYVASKFAVRGLSESLREELAGTEIHVCTILPASIDTPLFEHAANYSGRAIQPPGLIAPADRVAAAIARVLERPQREVAVGSAARGMIRLHRAAPRLFEWVAGTEVRRDSFGDEPAERTDGNLFHPTAGWSGISGGWRPLARERTAIAASAVGAVLLAPALLGAVLLRRALRPPRSRVRRLLEAALP